MIKVQKCNIVTIFFVIKSKSTDLLLCPPGPDYLKGLIERGKTYPTILSVSGVQDFMEEYKEIHSWMGNVKKYLCEMNQELLNDKTFLFVLECQIFLTNTTPKRSISVMVRTPFFKFIRFYLIWACMGERGTNSPP